MLGHYKSNTKFSKLGSIFSVLSVLAPALLAQEDLIKLYSADKPLPPSVIYDSRSITTELKCVSAVADDTAHLSGRPEAQIVFLNGPILVRAKPASDKGEFASYVASERALLDGANYTRVKAVDHRLSLPTSQERRVLIAIYRRRGQSAKAKIVWLIAPSAP